METQIGQPANFPSKTDSCMFIDNVGSLVAKTFFPSKLNDVLELSLQSVDTLE